MTYQALVVDIDGTLVGDSGEIHPATLERLIELQARGIPLVIATGRSEAYLEKITDPLGLKTPVVCYNGAALYDPTTTQLQVTHPLHARVVEDAFRCIADDAEVFGVCMLPGRKVAAPPRSADEAHLLEAFYNLEFVPEAELPTAGLIRLSLFSERHDDSEVFADEIGQRLVHEHYLTHFPLKLLPPFRDRDTQVIDLHAPCGGKAEALWLIEKQFGIPPKAVVAVGDAENDRPMIEQAGLGVAMENGMETLKRSADRVIGPCTGSALGELVHELFLDRA